MLGMWVYWWSNGVSWIYRHRDMRLTSSWQETMHMQCWIWREAARFRSDFARPWLICRGKGSGLVDGQ
jgi:hypothetical protein